MKKLPVLFIGHGSPVNILLENPFTQALRELTKSIPRPEVVLVVSAHWLTRGTEILASENPRQIYDFYGFTEELYDVNYRPKGSPRTASRAAELLTSSDVRLSSEWGLDHASWAVLKHMYPDADVPVLELSIDIQKNERQHYELASRLSALREEGVLVIGSGNVVHNLRMIDFENIDVPPYTWAVEFDEDVKTSLLRGDHESLIAFRNHMRGAALAVPTNDHYLPLMYVLGLQGKGESVTFPYEGFQNKSISMRCLLVS